VLPVIFESDLRRTCVSPFWRLFKLDAEEDGSFAALPYFFII